MKKSSQNKSVDATAFPEQRHGRVPADAQR